MSKATDKSRLVRATEVILMGIAAALLARGKNPQTEAKDKDGRMSKLDRPRHGLTRWETVPIGTLTESLATWFKACRELLGIPEIDKELQRLYTDNKPIKETAKHAARQAGSEWSEIKARYKKAVDAQNALLEPHLTAHGIVAQWPGYFHKDHVPSAGSGHSAQDVSAAILAQVA